MLSVIVCIFFSGPDINVFCSNVKGSSILDLPNSLYKHNNFSQCFLIFVILLDAHELLLYVTVLD